MEDWFHRFLFREYVKGIELSSEDTTKAVHKILGIFDKYGKETTFFVLGEVAERAPECVEDIMKMGHEVAYHGYSHRRLQELGSQQFEVETKAGVNLLYNITKQRVQGFRAPDFSLKSENGWALEILKRYGFKYDSSIFPVKTPMYGLQKSIIHPYFLSESDPSKEAHDGKLMEFPLLTYKAGFLKIPAAGGFYLRFFGPRFILESIRNMNKRGHPAMCYVHPWEICGFPEVALPTHIKLYAYYRVPCLKLFEKLVRSVDISSAIKVMEEYTE